MANTRTLTRSFSGGELTPEFYGRIDDVKYQTGLALCLNWITTPHGPVLNRPGTRYVNTVKYPGKRTRIIPFSFSATQTMVIEMGEGYFRFHTFGATLQAPTVAGTPAWNNTTNYSAGALVSYGGYVYSAVIDVPSGGAAPSTATPPPASTTSWVQTVPPQSTNPPGYTLVGDTLPSPAVAGDHVSVITYGADATPMHAPEYGTPRAEDFSRADKYTGYTGVTNSAPGTVYWHQIGAAGGSGAGGPYEVFNPYSESDLFDIHFTQSNDVLTLVHPNYPPAELRRLGATDWVFSNISFATKLVAPSAPGCTAHPIASPGTLTAQLYVATRVSDDGSEESVASAVGSCSNNLFDSGAYNSLTLGTTDRCNVYKQSGGLYGYIGQTTDGTFTDKNVAPDISRTPPINFNPFTGANNYPGAVGYVEQRRVFAGTFAQPQNVWMTRTGTESNLNYSIPVRDDDSVRFRIAAREQNLIRHVLSLRVMLLLSASAEWVVEPANGGYITPAVSVHPQSYVGANNTQPLIVNNNILFCAARGGHIRELGYSFQAGGYLTDDVSLRAPHLFDNQTIVDMGYAKAPYPIVWAISTSGKLLGLTYVPEQQIASWHQHTTGSTDKFESVAVVNEGAEDAVYVVVNRAINGAQTRFVERFASRNAPTKADAFFLDAGATYSGTPITTITSGLAHLEGMQVMALADGAVRGPFTVSGGSITLDAAYSTIQVGLPLVADLQTLPVAIELPGGGQGRPKDVNQVWLRVYRTSGLQVGPTFKELLSTDMRDIDEFGTPPQLATDEVQLTLSPSWNNTGQVCIRQSDPLPATLVALTQELSFGG